MNRSDHIMNVANRLILEKGYSAFSYADVAAEIGIQKASIHYHFPSKANLVQNVVSRYRQEVRGNLAKLDSMTGDPRVKLEQYLSYWESCLQSKAIDMCLCALLASEIPILPEEVIGEIRGHFRDLTDWLARLMKDAAEEDRFAGESEAAAIEETAHAILACVHGGMLASRTFNDAGQFGKVKNRLLGLITEKAVTV
ncbi:TetR/AcrR family transcriptional regulator [Paenibacillus sabinae]|uniref:TetR family transcriptional regulator n=1 Tax=Paenibacillus sabinae T27 TaxID=1268072 RepID=X4Z6H5_9BACL|nr:TetR/AcrR family transcriptional regulator [Paenibacillus sabinae]AHV95336.1 TetR family transcriptional regulator [Paenibacillus sabinae T27]